MVKQFVEVDVQTDTMKLGPVSSQNHHHYAVIIIKVARFALQPYEELLVCMDVCDRLDTAVESLTTCM